MSRKSLPIFVSLVMVIIGAFVSFTPAYAAGKGTIETGKPGGGGNSGGHSSNSSGGTGCKPSRSAICYRGWSWIFYKYVGGEEMAGQKIEFRPNGQHPWARTNKPPYYGITNTTISGVCANPNRKEAGFWHLGRNAESESSGTPFFVSEWREEAINLSLKDRYRTLNNNKYNDLDPYRFNIGYSRVGHMATFSMFIIREKKYGHLERVPLITDMTGTYDKTPQSLFVKKDGVYKKVYQAQKSAESSQVFEYFKDAYYGLMQEDYTGDYFPDDLYAFCYWHDKYILTAKSIDEDRNSLDQVAGLGVRKSDEIREGELASITRGTNDKYEFLGWKITPNATDYITDLESSGAPSYISGTKVGRFDYSLEQFNVRAITGDAVVYAVYREKNAFEGQINVIRDDNTVASVGYTAENGRSVTYNIENCDATSGCEVTFGHNIKRDHGNGETSYVVSRSGVNPSDVLSSGGVSFTANPKRVYTDKVVLRPGQTVCEKLSFNANDVNESVRTVQLTACVAAQGSVSSSLELNVRNNNISKYSSYQKEVYAKPTDNINYRAVYNPGAQYAFNLAKDKLSDWNNAFNVSGKISNLNFIYNNGDTSVKTEIFPSGNYTVLTTDVGSTMNETAATNVNDKVKTTPDAVVLKNVNGILTSEVSTKTLRDTTKVIVPYNFDTKVEISTDDNEILNAGGSKGFSYQVHILPKKNALTTNNESEMYATIVRNAKSKTIVYTTNGELRQGGDYAMDNLCNYFTNTISCKVGDEKNYNELNKNWNNGNGSSYSGSSSLMVPDVTAGAKICVAAAFYPSYSGADTNLDKAGSKMWRISDSKCFTVGKKPTFQVWGGSFYGGGNVSTYSMVKNSLAPNISINNGVIVFGSWAEGLVVARDKVSGLTSGAATGLSDNQAGGGSLETTENFCKYRTPLSFANYAINSSICPTVQATGLSGIEAKKITIDNFTEETTAINNDVTIGNTTINASNTYVVNTNGNVYINGDIIYQDGTYTELSEIPKAFIAAKNISIACNVKRIDAILIAKNKLDTCSGSNNDTQAGLDAPNRSNQLVINGAITTGILDLNRTFGAATGIYSKIPAEIINYDTSVILWGRSIKNSEDYGRVYQTYLHELAPRY